CRSSHKLTDRPHTKITSFSFFFFFQEEDGIRDRNVTGVQTCALPIYRGAENRGCQHPPHAHQAGGRPPEPHLHQYRVGLWLQVRSEERRVGKGCSVRWCRESVK